MSGVGATVLLVTNDGDLKEVLTSLLRGSGWDYALSANPGEVRELIEDLSPRLVVVAMRELEDTLRLCAGIVPMRRELGMSLVAMGDVRDQEGLSRVVELGVDDFLARRGLRKRCFMDRMERSLAEGRRSVAQNARDRGEKGGLIQTLARISPVVECRDVPQVVRDVLHALGKGGLDLKGVASLLKLNPVLPEMARRFARARRTNGRPSVKTTERVVSSLGPGGVEELVVGCLVFWRLTKDARRIRLDAMRFWEHSIASAVLCRRLSQTTGGIPPEQAFVSGLLHDIGMAVLVTHLPAAYARVLHRVKETGEEISEVEKEVLGLDHCEVGAVVVDSWGLPVYLRDPVANHHLPSTARGLRHLIRATHVILADIGLCVPGAYGFRDDPPEEVGSVRGLSKEHLRDLCADLHDQIVRIRAVMRIPLP